ncbi:MAG: hypothetical protein OHK0019_00910 [Saprospiraceae bacterium]
MKNSEINRAFLNGTTAEMKAIILQNIANHYGVSTKEIYEELTDEEAENIMDYITGKERAAIHVIYKKFCYSKGIAA